MAGNQTPEAFVKEINRAASELISKLSGADFASAGPECVRLLVLLNAVLQYDEIRLEIPQHRLVLFVKTTINWFNQGLLKSSPAIAELAKVFSAVIPMIKDVYGAHWLSIMEFIGQVWLDIVHVGIKDLHLPATHATIKLFAAMRKIHGDNDDADDAWNSSISNLNNRLIQLLKLVLSE